VSSVSLPKSGDYFQLAVVGGHLIVSGGPGGSLFDSDSTTTLSHGRASGICDSAAVDPSTLKLSDLKRGNCGDPALYHERAIAVSYWVTTAGTTTIATRIATVDPSAPDGYTLGPVVMSYPQCSDCWAQWIYGDGSLWIYDGFVGSSANPHGELLRVSETTGTVEQRWAMPSIDRPLVAVDADGFWLAPSNESGWPPVTPPSQLVRYRSLYRVSPGARAPARVFTIPGGNALWLVASAHTVWLEANRTPKPSQLWRLTGAAAKPEFHDTYAANSTQGGEYGEGAPTYAGNAAIGIYYVMTDFVTGSTTQRIVRLAPDGPSEQTVAVVTPPSSITPNSFAFSSPAAVALSSSLFFLDPRTRLYRVTPRSQSWREQAPKRRVPLRATDESQGGCGFLSGSG
jgi:hypothetical protein